MIHLFFNPFLLGFFFFLNPEIDRIKCNSSEIILNLSPDKEMFMIFHLALYKNVECRVILIVALPILSSNVQRVILPTRIIPDF